MVSEHDLEWYGLAEVMPQHVPLASLAGTVDRTVMILGQLASHNAELLGAAN